MKKRFLSAAVLAAFMAAIILFGGCPTEAETEDGGSWELSIAEVQVYDSRDALVSETGTVRLYVDDGEGGRRVSTIEVGQVIDGLLTLELPGTVPDTELSALFYDWKDDGTVDPLDHLALWAWGFEVYDDGREQSLGRLYWENAASKVNFLYSKAPLTVYFDDPGKFCYSFEAVSGWNCILRDDRTQTVINGSPPPDAKWIFESAA